MPLSPAMAKYHIPRHSRLAELALLVSFLFLEHKFSARWTKVMGTAEWKASRTRRWFKGLKPTVILLSRGISDAESSWRAGQGWQRKGRLRSVVWARTKPPPSECDKLEGGRWAEHHFCRLSERLPNRAGQQERQWGRRSPFLGMHQRF